MPRVLLVFAIVALSCPSVDATQKTPVDEKDPTRAHVKTKDIKTANAAKRTKTQSTRTPTAASTLSKTARGDKEIKKEKKQLAPITPAPTAVPVKRPHGWPKDVPHHCCPLATGQSKWQCLDDKCAKFEWRESKSALTAMLLQCFFGTFAAGYLYYGYTGFAVIQILLTLFPCCFGCFLACQRQCCSSDEGQGSSSLASKSNSKRKDYGTGSGQCEGAGVFVACDSVSSEEFGKGTGSGAGKKKNGKKSSGKSKATAAADDENQKDGCCSLMWILSISSALVCCGMFAWIIGVVVQIADYSIRPQQPDTCLEGF